MPIGTDHRLPADDVPSRTRVDRWAWCVRVALLLLVSPALLLVLIVGGSFVVAQAALRGLVRLSASLRGDHLPRSSDLAGPRDLPAARMMTSAAVAPRARRGRSA